MTSAVLHNVSNGAYHAGAGLSYSGVKRLLRSPWHFQALHEAHDAHPATPTAQQFAGTLAHCATLEPNEFDTRYRVGPEVSKNSNAWREFKAANPDSEIISSAQREVAFAQAASLRAHPLIGDLLAAGFAEASVYWHDSAHQILCKCRPDWVHPCGTKASPRAILVDVKTTGDASPDGFARAVASYGYHGQADWYCSGYEAATGIRTEGMVFAVVENEFPYACMAYMVDDEALLIARQRNQRALNTYARCLKANHWPSYPTDLQVIALPRYAAQAEARAEVEAT